MVGQRFLLKKTFQNGDSYSGEVVEGDIKDGRGEFLWAATGAKYDGEWADDQPQGKGTYTIPGETGYTYEGDFLSGKRSGRGVCTFCNGRKYEGEWFEDKMHGQGSLTGAAVIDNFVDYVGPFLNGERSGAAGVCRYTNGNVYKGTWLNDKQNGYGELQVTKASDTPGYKPRMGEPHIVSYKGEFRDNLPHGLGEFLYSDSSIYKGECEGFMRHGKGEHFTKKGDVYRGQFQRDVRHGKGLLLTKDGEYEGNWCDGLLEGAVTFRAGSGLSLAEGLIFYEGTCVKGELTGDNVVAKYRDGSSYTGSMLAGKRNGSGVLDKKPMSIFGIGEVLLQYTGEFGGGVPKGLGDGTFTFVASNSQAPSVSPIAEGVCGVFPSYAFSGRYTGMWAGGLPNGEGEWQWKQEQSYRGVVKAGLPDGLGVLTTPEMHYDGSFSRGFPDGSGTVCWKDDTKKERRYEGTWKEGYFDGEGTLTLRDASFYSGAWKKGTKDGRGVDVASKDYRYEGEFKDGKRHGQGTLFSMLDGMTYKGEFSMDEITGNGEMTLGDGAVIKGGFLKGKPHGTVEMKFLGVGIFKGQFNNGKVSGSGTMEYFNGDKYEGGFINGDKMLPLRHGEGVFYFVEGDILECTWKRNVLHGNGIYKTKSGDRVPRLYLDGVFRKSCSEVPNDASSESGVSNSVTTKVPEKWLSRPSNVEQQATVIRRSLPRRCLMELDMRRTSAGAATSAVGPNGFFWPAGLSDGFPIKTEAGVLALEQPTPGAVSFQTASGQTASGNVSISSASYAVCKNNSVSLTKGEPLREPAQRGSYIGPRGSLTPFGKDIGQMFTAFCESKKGVGMRLSRCESLVGENKELALRKSSVTNSKENEIHFLTEELRQLNERIRQEGITGGSPAADAPCGRQSGEMCRLDSLEFLVANRQRLVKRLHSILS